MARYFYIAKTFAGKEAKGTKEANDEYHLARLLHQEGYVLISSQLEGEKEKKEKRLFLPFLDRVGLTDKLMFIRNLQVMISAGISLPRALRTLIQPAKSKKLKKALLEISEKISQGESFSDSLKKYPDIFSELFVSMIKIGEESGTMEEVLKTLSKQIEREYELKSKIQGALIYPAVIVSAMLGVGFLMLIMVVPRLAVTFKELKIELPLTTKIIIGIGNFLTQQWLLSVLIIIVSLFFIRTFLKTKIGRKVIDTISLKTPFVSSLVKKINSAYTIRTLSSLFSAGVSIVRALEVTSSTLGNGFYKKAIQETAEKVKTGLKLSDALQPYENIYPVTMIQMIAVGEESGETATILTKLADFFEEEVSNATRNLTAVIEPILMLFIGAAVGFFAISMIQPIYAMMSAIK